MASAHSSANSVSSEVFFFTSGDNGSVSNRKPASLRLVRDDVTSSFCDFHPWTVQNGGLSIRENIHGLFLFLLLMGTCHVSRTGDSIIIKYRKRLRAFLRYPHPCSLARTRARFSFSEASVKRKLVRIRLLARLISMLAGCSFTPKVLSLRAHVQSTSYYVKKYIEREYK